MLKIKVNGTNIITFPYTPFEMKADDPSFDENSWRDVEIRYNSSEEAKATGNQVMSVVLADYPDINVRTHKATQNQLPDFIDGEWKLNYTVTAKTEEEIAQFDIDRSTIFNNTSQQ